MLETSADGNTRNVKTAASIFKEYGDFIYTIISYKVKDKTLADDLYQDFFLSIASNPPPADNQNIKGYLYKAIINDIVDNSRRINRYQTQLQRYSECLVYSDAQESPENLLMEAEEIDKVLSVIEGQLQDSEASAVTLRYMQDYKIRDVAVAMKTNNTAAWRCVVEGVKKIRFFLRTW